MKLFAGINFRDLVKNSRNRVSFFLQSNSRDFFLTCLSRQSPRLIVLKSQEKIRHFLKFFFPRQISNNFLGIPSGLQAKFEQTRIVDLEEICFGKIMRQQ